MLLLMLVLLNIQMLIILYIVNTDATALSDPASDASDAGTRSLLVFQIASQSN